MSTPEPPIDIRALTLLAHAPHTVAELAKDLDVAVAEAQRVLSDLALPREVWALSPGGTVVWYATAKGLERLRAEGEKVATNGQA